MAINFYIRMLKLEEAVKTSAKQFRFYEESHRQKGTPDADRKAVKNAEMAFMCEEALKE